MEELLITSVQNTACADTLLIPSAGFHGRLNIDRQNQGVHDGNVQHIRITTLYHPLHGQSLKVVRRIQKSGEPHFVVELPNNHTQLIPTRYTEAATATLVTSIEPMLFSPGSLRALVKIVAHLYNQQQPEATHEPDILVRSVDDFQSRDTTAVDLPVDRTAPSSTPGSSVSPERSDR